MISIFNSKLFTVVIENIHQLFTFSFTETYCSFKGASSSYKNRTISKGHSRQNLNKLIIHQLSRDFFRFRDIWTNFSFQHILKLRTANKDKLFMLNQLFLSFRSRDLLLSLGYLVICDNNFFGQIWHFYLWMSLT